MSDTIDTGGPAHPCGHIDADGNIIGITLGMSLRDHFAGLAMQGAIASNTTASPERLAVAAYNDADAMIQARKEQS